MIGSSWCGSTTQDMTTFASMEWFVQIHNQSKRNATSAMICRGFTTNAKSSS